jgi:hypothetical protein
MESFFKMHWNENSNCSHGDISLCEHLAANRFLWSFQLSALICITLVTDFKGWRILRLHFAPIIDACRRDIRVAQPFLDLGDVRFVVQRVGGGDSAYCRS